MHDVTIMALTVLKNAIQIVIVLFQSAFKLQRLLRTMICIDHNQTSNNRMRLLVGVHIHRPARGHRETQGTDLARVLREH